MADNSLRLARAVESMQKATEAMVVSQEKIAQALSKIHHPAFRNREDEIADVVVEELTTAISLELPDISGTTTIYRQKDGFLRVEVLVEPKDADRLVGLVDSMGIREFVVSATDPYQ